MPASDSEIKSLKTALSTLEQRVSMLENKAGIASQTIPAQKEVPTPAPVYTPTAPIPTKEVNLETLLGGNWLVKIGIAALVLGVGFFLKLAFDNGWIGPVGRVLIGIVISFILLFVGERFQKKYTTYAQILTGGGIAVFYVSVYAAYAFYSLINSYLALGFMAVVTATSGLLSLRYNKPSVAIIGIIGGFISPFIFLKTLPDYLLIAYIIVLDYGIIGLSALKNWRKLILVGMIGSFIDYVFWTQTAIIHPSIMMQEIVLTIIFLIFAFSSILWHFIWKKSAEDSDLAIITLNAAFYFGVSYVTLLPDYKDFLGIFTFLLALFYFILAYFALMRSEIDARLTLFLSGVCIVFLTLAMPIALHTYSITIAWATEALVLIWLGFSLRSFHFRLFGFIVYILAGIRLLLFDSFFAQRNINYTPFLNDQFFPFLIAVVSLYGAAYLYSKNMNSIDRADEKSMHSILLSAANFFTLWALTSEVIQYFNQKIEFSTMQIQDMNKNWNATHNYQGLPSNNSQFLEQAKTLEDSISNLQNAQNFIISFLWMAYSIGLIGAGFLKRIKILRILGLILFWITILKVFMFDMFQIGGSFRVASFITLGVILLLTGYLYQRFSKKFKELLIASIVLILLFTPVLKAFAEFTTGDWRYKKEITLPTLSQKNLVELTFDNAIYNKSSKDLHDLRIINQNGVEVPYKFLIANSSHEESFLEGRIINNSFVPGTYTTFVLDLLSAGKLNDSITIILAAQNFRREVTIEGSDDAKSWQTLKNNGVIYDYSDAQAGLYARNTTVQYPQSSVRYLRVFIKGEPITVTGAQVGYEKQTQSQTITYGARVVENTVDKGKKANVIVTDLGYTGLPNNSLLLKTHDTNFERDVLIEGSNDTTNWAAVKANNVIFSLQTPKFTGSSLSLTYPENTNRYLRITIFNRDNSPLTIDGVSISGVVRKLVFEVNPADTYQLYYGDTSASYPEYDIERYFQYLDIKNLPDARLGGEVQNPKFIEKPPPQPPLTERFPWLLPSALGVSILILGAFVVNLIKTTKNKFPQTKKRRH